MFSKHNRINCYDFENQRPIEILVGLEYNSCCFALQVLGNRFLRPNDGLSKPEYTNSVYLAQAAPTTNYNARFPSTNPLQNAANKASIKILKI